MAGKKSAERKIMLNDMRGKWFTLHEPDFKFGSDGNYGVGVILNEASAQVVNAAVIAVENESGESGPRYNDGDTLKVNMIAGGINKKTKKRFENTPIVYNADTSPATTETLKELTRKSKFNISVRVSSYPEIGKPDPETGEYPKGCRAGGISTKFLGMQIITLDAGEPSAAELGFSAVEVGAESAGGDDY